MDNTAVVMERGINALLKNLGVLDTEQFISTLLKEPFNYTEWSRKHYADVEFMNFTNERLSAIKTTQSKTCPVKAGRFIACPKSDPFLMFAPTNNPVL